MLPHWNWGQNDTYITYLRKYFAPNDSPRVVHVLDDDTSIHSVLRRTGPCRIFTWVAKKGIHYGPYPVAVEAYCLITEFWARHEARAWRSDRMIEEFSDSKDEDEEEMMIPNAMWYSNDAVVPVQEHVVTPPVEEHQSREELVSYPQ
ncbi:unnamed protein product [Lupinus luteus]|uniref:Uncharacterized protein n=1 Tax=Lupinus luteus TaxID=3873 RepID=A0AAV1X0S3_LUPLU